MGINPSVGSVGDSYDNALAETVIGLFKTEVINRRGPWRSLEDVEYATLEWVD
jgi:transposase InsO family protein